MYNPHPTQMATATYLPSNNRYAASMGAGSVSSTATDQISGMPVAWIANFFIALAVFLGAFPLVDPAPYELLLAAMLGISLLFGMKIPRNVMPVLVCFSLYATGGLISSFMIEDISRGLIYISISFFMGLTATFFAVTIGNDGNRLRMIFRIYVVGAVITTILGLLGYFGVSGFGIFTRYSRAMGAFQDPNVYAPFLVAPILYLVYGIVNRSAALMLFRTTALGILIIGLFLAFSRAAWGLAVFCGPVFYLLLLICEQKAASRLKYILVAAIGVISLVLMIAFALQIPAVSDLFAQRFRVVQDYDGGEAGRFARHVQGYLLAFERPFGVGPLEFGFIFNEDPHNNFVKALMSYGWLGFVAWVTITVWTLIAGFKLLFRPRPWQVYHQIAYVVFVGHTLVGNVIDTNHWRHYYLMIGIVWGCIILEKRWQLSKANALPSDVLPSNNERPKPGLLGELTAQPV